MRLEHEHDAAIGITGLRRRERRLNLGRVMAIVIHDRDDAVSHLDVAKILETPIDTFESLQRGPDRIHADLQLLGHGDRGEGVADIMHSRQAQRDVDDIVISGAHHVEFRARFAEFDVRGAQVRVRLDAVSHDRATDIAEDVANSRIVGAYDGEAVERKIVQELDEAGFQFLDIAVVGRHVIGVDIGHDGQHRLEIHERGVAFVGFSNEVVALP